jgi:hypothetical protein
MQGDSGRAATALTGEQFAALPALRELPAAIATHAAARFPRAGMDAVTVSADGCARAEVLSAQAVHILAMDTLELEFAPGYRIRLIAVATATRAACAGGSAPRVRRLAHLGKIWVLPRQPAAAGAALNTALAAVAADLGAQVALYLQAQDPGVP